MYQPRFFCFKFSVFAVFCFPIAALAQSAIQLEGLPDKLSFPMAKGTNRVLTATVRGGPADAVWLGVDQNSATRVNLLPIGEDRFQINLADREVLDFVHKSGAPGQFYVFARVAEGRILRSIAIVYEVTFMQRQTMLFPQLYLVTKEKREKLPDQSDYACLPEEIVRLEFEIASDLMAPNSLITIGTQSWDFARSEKANVVSLEITDEIREPWTKQGWLLARFRIGDASEEASVVVRALSRQIIPKPDPTSLMVQEHSYTTLPGAHQSLRLNLTNVHGDMAAITITQFRGTTELTKGDLHVGESLTFEWYGKSYAIVLDELVNRVTHGDHVRVLIYTGETFRQRQQIDRLIELTETTEEMFLRDGKEMSGESAAKEFRMAIKAHIGDQPTLEEFLKMIDTGAPGIGAPYKVVRKNGDTVSIGAWFAEQKDKLQETTEPKDK